MAPSVELVPTFADVDTFRAEAVRWLAANQAVAPPDYGAIVPPELVDDARVWQRALFDAGYAGVHWPEAWGGRGLTPEHQAAWLEEAARAGAAPFLNMVGLVLAGGAILGFGNDEQRAHHLPPTLRGERVWCQLFSEPGAGSDLASLAARAVPDGEGWVVSGQKTWCSNGGVADWGILLARTDPDAAAHRGISFLLLDMRSPGVEVAPIRQMTGGSSFDEVFLDEVHVPSSCLVGTMHGGWGVAMATLSVATSARSPSRSIGDSTSSSHARHPVRRPPTLGSTCSCGVVSCATSASARVRWRRLRRR